MAETATLQPAGCRRHSRSIVHDLVIALLSNRAESLTFPCTLRYRKDFGSPVVARLMAWRPALVESTAVFFRSFYSILGEF